ncbi:DUF3487 family protein [Pseudomonas aeruginosa]|nr:DUF3487 family protein [Pseudomonas aeruginosa]TEP55335.1 DUF3487 family protein [Pseudomonas aeruginosa]
MFSCSIIEQKQLNTWVSFQSAEQPLLGQFSVSGNRLANKKRGRAQMWFYRAIQMRLSLSQFASLFAAFGLADRNLVLKASHWSVRRK